MAKRFWSVVHANFFFQPGQLVLELPDLLKEAISFLLERLLFVAFAAIKDLRQLAQKVFLPLPNQIRMDPILTGQFVDGMVLADGFQGHARLKVGAKAAALSSHGP